MDRGGTKRLRTAEKTLTNRCRYLGDRKPCITRSRRRVGRCEFSDEVFGLPPRLPRRHEVQRPRLMVQRGRRLRPQWEKRSMKHSAGLDVSVKETSVCIVDETGKICREI